MPSLVDLPRVSLAFLPTPLHEAPNLARALGGPRIFIKRDDMTGLALGGNKARKLEFLVADALAHKANVLITSGALQSNHCRQTAAAARKLGLRCVLILTPSHHEAFQGNILLDSLLKAEVRRCPLKDREDTIARAAADEYAKGNTPYVIAGGGSTGLGAMGYASMMTELNEQLRTMALSPAAMYFSSGSAGTQAGMILGQVLSGSTMALVGISPGRAAAEVRTQALVNLESGAHILGLDFSIAPDQIEVHDTFVGSGYGVSSPASLEALRLFAECEGILIDPVYTAKAAAGMIAHIRGGRFTRDESVIFVHTGGTPALFAYADEMDEPRKTLE